MTSRPSLWLALFLATTPAYPAGPRPHPDLLTLENPAAKVVLAPNAGGRIIYYGPPQGPNLLLAPNLDRLSNKNVPQPKPETEWVQLFGHVVWISPQSRFWAALPQPNRILSWPPDPWLEFGRIENIQRRPQQIQWDGPLSPLNGGRVSQRLTLLPSGTLHLLTTYTNHSDQPVNLAIWTNTRVPPTAQAAGPLEPGETFRFEFHSNVPERERPWPFTTLKNFFHLDLSTNPHRVAGKAFFSAPRPFLTAWRDGYLFTLRPDRPTPIHSSPQQHAPIEVYGFFNPANASGLLELEFHSPQTELPPGGRLEFGLAWAFEPMPPPPTPTDLWQAGAAAEAKLANQPLP
ncbi:MAG: DUF4380 domain-containing protein [Verrucomicrobiia bacterium]